MERLERKWWTLIAVCTAIFMLLLDITVVNVALPDMQRDLDASFAQLQWVVDAYALTLATTVLAAGSLADIFGRRRVFTMGLVLFTAASFACGIANDAGLLIAARAVQGVGGGIMFAVSLALLANAFQGRDRGTAFGIWGATTGAAVAIGPLVGGVLTEWAGWRWIFFVNIPIGVAAIVLTLMRVDESKSPHPGRVDWLGTAALTSSLFLLVYGLLQGNQEGWSSTLIRFCLIGAVVLHGGVRGDRAHPPRSDARHPAVSRSGLRRRPDRGVLDLCLDLRGVPLPDALPPERPRLLAARRRAPVPAVVARRIRRGCGLRATSRLGSRRAG